jgi:hypothetical protein
LSVRWWWWWLARYETSTEEEEANSKQKTAERLLAIGDPRMVAFLRGCRVSDEQIVRFVAEHVDYEVLTGHCSKEDLAHLLPQLGIRLRVWAAIEKERKAAASASCH